MHDTRISCNVLIYNETVLGDRLTHHRDAIGEKERRKKHRT
jgi:hypothetical protein